MLIKEKRENNNKKKQSLQLLEVVIRARGSSLALEVPKNFIRDAGRF